MDAKKTALLRELQQGFKLEKQPFRRIAKDLGFTEEEVLAILRDCLEQGLIRRLGIAVRPDRIGQKGNALVAWKVPEARMEEVGKGFAAFREVSHCYERECPPGWPYNLFTMIHAPAPEELDRFVAEQATRWGLSEFKVFRTQRELKKTSMKYFEEKAG